ncbi:MAG TPA: molybdenum cofactor guanylyltransferase [Hanamia sp.]
MTGVILCGGKSARMGVDKGLIEDKGVAWAQSAFNKVASLGLPVALSVNPEQFNSYSSAFDEPKLIIDNNELQLKGPLLGVMSAHLKYPSEDLLVLACDMPFMGILILQKLKDQYQLDVSMDAIVYTNNGEPEPLCAVYSSSALVGILQKFYSGILVKYSMKNMIEHINPYFIVIEENEKKFFKNINTHTDLNGL